MDAAALKEILCKEMRGYAKQGYNSKGYLTINDDQTLFAVVYVSFIHGERIADVGLIARVVDNAIVIETDTNNKTLVDALLQAGVPREQIVLAYAGEPVPMDMLG
jgi:hypothetical protein